MSQFSESGPSFLAQTGRYPWHIGQQTQMNLNPTPGIACGINLKYDFLPKMLKQKGYATWALGKVRFSLTFSFTESLVCIAAGSGWATLGSGEAFRIEWNPNAHARTPPRFNPGNDL
jgi:arylsulfatase A-like enzyme